MDLDISIVTIVFCYCYTIFICSVTWFSIESFFLNTITKMHMQHLNKVFKIEFSFATSRNITPIISCYLKYDVYEATAYVRRLHPPPSSKSSTTLLIAIKRGVRVHLLRNSI